MSSTDAKPGVSSGPSKAPLLLSLSNSVVVLGAIGMLFYTKMMYKRPLITEDTERARLSAIEARPKILGPPGFVTFEPVTVNIEPTPGQVRPADGTPLQLHGKLHYVTVGFSLEIKDASQKDAVEAVRPMLMDRLLSMLGKKPFQELITVQGRYLLRTQLLEHANQLISKQPSDGLVTNIYFTQFIVQ